MIKLSGIISSSIPTLPPYTLCGYIFSAIPMLPESNADIESALFLQI